MKKLIPSSLALGATAITLVLGAPTIKPEKPEEIGKQAEEPRGRTADAPIAPKLFEEDNCFNGFTGQPGEAQQAKRKEGLAEINFSVKFGELVTDRSLMSFMIMPGEAFEFSVPEQEGYFTAYAEKGEMEVKGPRSWRWTAPGGAGIYPIKIADTKTKDCLTFQAMVLTPYDGRSKIGSYRIGSYKDQALNGNPRYNKPRGFIKVEKGQQDLWVTPHLQIGQFLCKQGSAWPKYLLLESRLLLKLEAIVSRMKEKGIPPDALYITSAFRTPYYNVSLGNKTSYSRHLYGDAADIFIDEDGDYRLDDLNNDGKVNNRDAKYLSRVVDKVSNDLPDHFKGGLGFYGFQKARTAFIHTDTRGASARWGFTKN